MHGPRLLRPALSVGLAIASPQTMREHMNAWLQENRAGRRPNTITGYRCILERHILSYVPEEGGLALGERPLQMVHRRHLRAALASMLQREYAPNTARTAFGALCALFSEAVTDEIIGSNPALRCADRLWPTRKRAAPRAYLPAQLERLMLTSRARCPQFLGLFLVLSRTGLRLGEALGLQRQHVDLADRWLYVGQTYHSALHAIGEPKTDRSFRYVDLSPDAVIALTDALGAAEDIGAPWLFANPDLGTPYHHRSVEAAFRIARLEAGLEYGTPHALRHTFASWMISAGATVQAVMDALGHSSIQTTVDTYGSWFRMRSPEMAAELDQIARGKFNGRMHLAPAGSRVRVFPLPGALGPLA